MPNPGTGKRVCRRFEFVDPLGNVYVGTAGLRIYKLRLWQSTVATLVPRLARAPTDPTPHVGSLPPLLLPAFIPRRKPTKLYMFDALFSLQQRHHPTSLMSESMFRSVRD